MTVECVLCADEAEFVGVGECNHEAICYRCIYKMRIISKNKSCPMCKAESKHIIIASQFRQFKSFTDHLSVDKTHSQILYEDERAEKAFQKLMQFKCFVKFGGKPCKNDKKFPSIAFLKKHLKEDHNRYICEICLEKKTCVLQEQKVYSFQALHKHMERGDLDQFGNITFMHPYCKFCNRYFFDEEEFRMHINIEHIKCSVCGPNYKYIFYKDYDSLDKHHKISHYVCSQNSCVAKKFIAFKTAEELKIHRLQIHDKTGHKKVDARQMCGFKYEGHVKDDQQVEIKDKEGVDMEYQFLSMKKTKNRALAEADIQSDYPVDIREFFPCDLSEQDHFHAAFSMKLARKKTGDAQLEKPQEGKKKKKYVEKTKVQEQKPNIANQNQVLQLEDLKLLSNHSLSKLSYDNFQSHLKRVLKDNQLHRFNDMRTKLNKGKMNPADFVKNYFDMMKSVCLKSAYQIFPHFLRTIQNDQLKQDLDLEFLKVLRTVPSKSQSLVIRSKNYSDFFKTLFKEIEDNIESRIRDRSLSLKKPIKRCKERLYQIIGVVRRLKISEMAKFKFAANFGLQNETIEFLIEKVFKMNSSNISNRLNKISNEEIVDLYVFVKYCYYAIEHSNSLLLEKNKIHQEVLEDFLYERPQLQIQFGKKKNELTFEEQVEFEKQLQTKKMKKHIKQLQVQNKKRGYETKTDFNLVDKGDFPELVANKKSVHQQKRQQQFSEVVEEGKNKPATYKKKINQMFPALGDQEEQFESLSNKKSNNDQPKPQKPVEQKKQKAWWQKLNEKPIDQDYDVVQVKTKGKKKKVQWVQVKGLFN